MYTIYALVDPRDYTVHYVGQTTDVYQRFNQHINGEGSSFTKNAWIFELRALNCMVIMETLEEVDTYQLSIEREAYWIKHFAMLKEPLFNVTHRAALKRVKKDQRRAANQAATQVLAAIETRKGREVTNTETLPEPTPQPVQTSKENNAPVETAIRETIRRMKEARESDRKISRFVGLSGRKYGMYQQICRELGFVTEKAE
jgi:predicted GIY-YIG superfamily endonuclease